MLPDGGTWQYEYNARGDVVSLTDPKGGVTRFEWNEQGDLLLRLDGLKLDYDGFGRLMRRQDKSGVVQHFAYHDEQRVKEIRFEGNSEFRRVEYR